jgi:PucR C-terminal helix-turn-helix domain/GGDEF-like domain
MDDHGDNSLATGSRPSIAAGPQGREASFDSSAEMRSMLSSALRERRLEIEATISTRVHAISDPRQVADARYLQSLTAAVAAAIDLRLAVLEGGRRRSPALPVALLAQARLDARVGVSLDTVLRRYLAGGARFVDFLAEEAERARVANPALRRLLGEQATLGERLIAAAGEEYDREAKGRLTTSSERRRECVKSLLAGELVDDSALGYELGGHHIALMAKGVAVAEAIEALAGRLDRRLLAVRREEEPVWACWLGGRRPLDVLQTMEALREIPLDGVLVSIGEPAEGQAGWRFSHRQAKAALPVAERSGEAIVRYADVALLASVLDDDLLATSLRRLYLEPLEKTRDGGKSARETLRAWFAAERNVTSTAAALGVDRRTVTNRVRAIEKLYGRPLKEVAAELETALQLAD